MAHRADLDDPLPVGLVFFDADLLVTDSVEELGKEKQSGFQPGALSNSHGGLSSFLDLVVLLEAVGEGLFSAFGGEYPGTFGTVHFSEGVLYGSDMFEGKIFPDVIWRKVANVLWQSGKVEQGIDTFLAQDLFGGGQDQRPQTFG